jgi:peroxiredoxin/DNA-binding HxlR family transcriptional regulator
MSEPTRFAAEVTEVRREDLGNADCGIAQTLGLIGDWWSWLILRDIAGGASRFDQLQGALGISRRSLSERLAGLVDDGVLLKLPYSERPLRHDYVLTPRGEGLLPVLLAMQEFGDRHLLGDGTITAAPGPRESERVHSHIGTHVPTVTLSAHDDHAVTLGASESWQVLYCFPGAWVPASQGYPPGWNDIPGAAGCTLESTTYAARYADFASAGSGVYGVSTQRPDQLAAFADFAGLPFQLLSDQDGDLASALRLPMFRSSGVDRLKRQTLLIDPEGVIRHVQAPITDPVASADEMLAVVRAHT